MTTFSSSNQNHELVSRIYEAINKRDFQVLDDIIAADYQSRDPRCPEEDKGPKVARRIATILTSAAPDLTYTIESIETEDNGSVRVAYTLRGTHSGEVMGIPASGHEIEISGVSYSRVAEGKIVETTSTVGALDVIQALAGDPTIKNCP